MKDTIKSKEIEKTKVDEESNQNKSYKTIKDVIQGEKWMERENNKDNCNLIIVRKNINNDINKNKGDNEMTVLYDTKTVTKFSPFWRQTLSSAGPIIMMLTAGFTLGYSAILLPQLRQYKNNILINDDLASWIASIAILPMAPGCIIGGLATEKFGRRNGLLIFCGPFFFGWILIAFSNTSSLMLLGRFITGFCVGFISPIGSVFVSEITSPRYRGLLLAALSLAIAFGIFIVHYIGIWISWQWTAVICSGFPILSGLLLTFVPESSLWLISKGKINEGVDAFNWFRGYDDESQLELQKMVHKYTIIKFTNIKTPYNNDSPCFEMWKSKQFLKPLFIVFIFYITSQFSGLNVFAFYSLEMIEIAVGKGLDKYLVLIIFDSVRIIMAFIACFTTKQFGRRPSITISGVFVGIAMISLSIFLYFFKSKADLAFIPLCLLLLYISSLSIGLIPMQFILISELFPNKYRGQGSGIGTAIACMASFTIVKIAPFMMTFFGEVITFFIYGMFSLVGTGILFFILPETNKITLQDIEEVLKIKPNKGYQ